jgi:hypothetical protein
MLDAVGQEAFFTDDAHFGERATNASGQKRFAQACQGRRVRTAEEVRRDRQVKLVDEIMFE